jgi:hypothetical protein
VGCTRVAPLHLVRKDAPKNPIPIVVDTIANRSGQRLRSSLIQELRDIPVPTKERYVLKVYLAEGGDTMGRIGRSYSAAFFLRKVKDKSSVCSGGVSAAATYGAAGTSGQVSFTVFNSIDDSMIDQISGDIVEKIRIHFQDLPKL